MVVFVLSPVSDELEALARSGISTPKIPQSGIARSVITLFVEHVLNDNI